MSDLSHLSPIGKVYLELTNRCNLSCDFCPSKVSQRKPQFMEFGLFKAAVDEIERENITRLIGFHILGEPLLHPRVLDAVEYTKSKGLKAAITTNGSLLSGAMMEELIRLGLDRLIISLDSHNTKSIKGDSQNVSDQGPNEYYERIFDAVRAVKRSSSRMKIKLSLVNVWAKKFFDIDDDVGLSESKKEFRKRLSDLVCGVLPATGHAGSSAEAIANLSKRNLKSHRTLWLDRNIGITIRSFSDWGNAFNMGSVHPARIGFCGIAFSTLGVLSDGSVTICCGDYDGNTSLGNLNDTSLMPLLNSGQARQIAEGFHRYRVVHPHCQKCFGAKSRSKAFVKGLLSIYAFKLKKRKKRKKNYLLEAEASKS